MAGLLLIVVVIAGLVFLLSRIQGNSPSNPQPGGIELEDAIADARRWIERLGSQVLSLTGSDSASTQALADASERYNAASSQISTARTVRQAELARESALEGLYYVNAAREIMGMPKGPEIPPLEGQCKAGKVTENRTVEVEGRQITASPQPTSSTPNYYPGGMVAGRPVPAGWYSEPWWQSALRTGLWTAGSVMLFSALFSGMSGVGYSAAAFENGYGEGFQDGLDAANDFDGVDGADGSDFGDFDGGDYGDLGGDFGGDFGGGFDGGGFDFGGFDF